jgi:large subunit ribosomal protein L18
MNKNQDRKTRRITRIRKKIAFVSDRPRLTVFRSNMNIYAQIIDDSKAKTLVAASSKETKATKKMEQAQAVGKLIAEKAKTAKIKTVVFDKGAYKFHGRVKALADGAREGGLIF